MPRTRRSTSLAASASSSSLLATRKNAKSKPQAVGAGANAGVELTTKGTHTNANTNTNVPSPMNNKSNNDNNNNNSNMNLKKKRTVSDRSPAINNKTKAPKQIQVQVDTGMGMGMGMNTGVGLGMDYSSPDKENLLPTPTKSGVTPYWKIAEERGISPRMTRSASKRQTKIPRFDSASTSPTSTSSDKSNDSCAKGLFLSPDHKKAKKASGASAANSIASSTEIALNNDDRSKKSNYKPLTPIKGSSGKIMGSPTPSSISNALVAVAGGGGGGDMNMNHMSNEVAELKARNYDFVKKNALLKAENAILKKDAAEMNAKLRQETEQMAREKETLLIKVAKLESHLESKTRAMDHTKEVHDLTTRVDGMHGEMLSYRKSMNDSNRLGEKDGERIEEHERIIRALKRDQQARLDEKDALLRQKDEMIQALKKAKEDNEHGEKVSEGEHRAELDVTKNELGEMKDKYKKLKLVHREAEKKYEETLTHAKSTMKKANDELSNRDKQARELASKLAAREKQVNDLESQLKNVNVSKEEADALVHEMNEEMETIQQAVKATTEENKAQLQKQTEMLEAENEESKETIQALEAELKSIRDVLTTTEESNIGLETETKQLKNELGEHKQTIAHLETELECSHAKSQTDSEMLQTELAEKTQIVETIQSQMKSMEASLNTTEESKAKLERKNDMLNAELEQSRQAVLTLEAESSRSREECEHLRSLLRQANEEKEENVRLLNTTQDQVDMSVQETNTLKSQLEESDSKMLAMQNDFNRHKEQMINEKKADKARVAELITLLESKTEELCVERGHLLEKVAEKEKLIRQKDNGINEIQKRCMAMMAQLNKVNAREGELLQKILRQEQVRRSLHNKVMQLSGNIRVYIRVRPRLSSEAAKSEEQTFSFPSLYDNCSQASSSVRRQEEDLTKKFIVATEPFKDRGGLSQRRRKLKFGFDNVFSPNEGQDDIWKATEPLVQSAVDGYNVCLFAYGQTGSGKTYTMLGNDNSPGIVTRAVGKIFESRKLLEDVSSGSTSAQISVELLEIYNETVRDLMSKKDESYKKLNITMNSNEPIGNKVISVSSEREVLSILAMAQKRRCVKATMSNEESSRSHLIFTMNFTVKNEAGVVRNSKLHICDLAGSERLKHSQSYGSTLNETKHINKSLSTLSNVIEKLQSKSTHVPFRESKLTYLLHNSLGGDSKTLAIVCCNPLSEHFQESSCSLRFAQKLNKVELKAMGSTTC